MSLITPLWYTNLVVDNIQNAKKQFVETFIFDDKVKEPLKDMVETQRDYAKEVNRSVSQLFNTAMDSFKTTYDKFSSTVV